MTTLTTSLALVPMALGIGEGSEINAPLARVIIGGILISALFTTFFVPTLYSAIKGISRK
jgi:HAE1 family hydrophobic/amphiphilic exporter-1